MKPLLEIRKFEKLKELIIKVPFHRRQGGLLMDLFLKKARDATRWQAQAKKDLQWAIEVFISDLFSGAVEAMIQAKRVTLMPRDIHLAIRMKGYDKGILDEWPPGKPKP